MLETFDNLTRKLFAALPASLQSIEQDIQQKFKDILQANFAKMNLVTREEFDVQVKVLERTREKVEKLQDQLNKLQKNNSAPSKDTVEN